MLDPEVVPSEAHVQRKPWLDFPVIADIARNLIEAIAAAKLWGSHRQRYSAARKLTLRVHRNLELLKVAAQEVVQRLIDAGSQRFNRRLVCSKGPVVLNVNV